MFSVISIPESEIDTIPKLLDSGIIVVRKKAIPKYRKNNKFEANYKP